MSEPHATKDVVINFTFLDRNGNPARMEATHQLASNLCTKIPPATLEKQQSDWFSTIDKEHRPRIIDEGQKTCIAHSATSTGIEMLTDKTLLDAETPVVHNWVVVVCEKGMECGALARNAMFGVMETAGEESMDLKCHLTALDMVRQGIEYPFARSNLVER